MSLVDGSLFAYNPNCIRAALGVNGSGWIMDGIALKCDLHSSLTFRARRSNVITESFGGFRADVHFVMNKGWAGAETDADTATPRDRLMDQVAQDAPFSCKDN